MKKGKHAKRGSSARHAKPRGQTLPHAFLRTAGYPAFAAALCALLLVPALAGAVESGASSRDAQAQAQPSTMMENAHAPSAKDETVYAYTDANGNAKSTEVAVKLHNAAANDLLADTSTLSDLEGDEGLTPLRHYGTGVVWDSHGKDVSYRGVANEPLPVSIEVTYRLNGKMVQPDQLEGQSGRVNIRYSFANKQLNGTDGVYTPFTVITGLLLDQDVFSNITTENARVIEDGDTSIVVGFALPGLKESLGALGESIDELDYFEISADATDFRLGTGLTLMSTELLDSSDAGQFDAAELRSQADALTDASKQLVDGARMLQGGLGQLEGSSGQFAQGIAQINDEASALPQSARQIEEGAKELEGGIAQLDAALQQADGAACALADETQGIPAAMDAIDGLASAGTSVPAPDSPELALIKTMLATSSDPNVVAASPQVSALLDYATASAQTTDKLSSALSQLQAKDALVALAIGLHEAARNVAESLAPGSHQLSSALSHMSAGADELSEGLGVVADGASQLAASTTSASEGADALADGLQQFDDAALSQVADLISNKIGGSLDRVRHLIEAGKTYNNFSGITEGTQGTVRFVIETDAIGS